MTQIKIDCMYIDGLAFNWVTNELYYTDEILDIVGAVNLVGLSNRILIRTGNDTRPRAIVLDPPSG